MGSDRSIDPTGVHSLLLDELLTLNLEAGGNIPDNQNTMNPPISKVSDTKKSRGSMMPSSSVESKSFVDSLMTLNIPGMESDNSPTQDTTGIPDMTDISFDINPIENPQTLNVIASPLQQSNLGVSITINNTDGDETHPNVVVDPSMINTTCGVSDIISDEVNEELLLPPKDRVRALQKELAKTMTYIDTQLHKIDALTNSYDKFSKGVFEVKSEFIQQRRMVVESLFKLTESQLKRDDVSGTETDLTDILGGR